MDKRYESDIQITSYDPFEDRVLEHYASLPVIERLDEYIHFRTQLKAMRARSTELNAARFAMEMGLYFRLADYEARIGVPQGAMPLPDGEGGVVPETAIPVGWL